MFFDSWGLPENVMQCMIFLILFASWVFRLLPYLLCLYAFLAGTMGGNAYT